MNLADYPTPETDGFYSGPCKIPMTARHRNFARNLEQRLSACRSVLSAIKNVEAVRPEIHDEITRILTETSPKK